MSWRPDHDPIWVLELTVAIEDPDGVATKRLPFWRRPCAADLFQADDLNLPDGSSRRVAFMLRRLTGFHSDQIAQMDGYDFDQAARIVTLFFVRGPDVEISRQVLGLSRGHSPASTSSGSTSASSPAGSEG